MKINVSVEGFDAAKARLLGMGKQVNFAAAVALTRTAKLIQDEIQREIPAVFDRPKPQTVSKSTFILKATKSNLQSTIGFKQRSQGVPAAEYLHPNIGDNGRRSARNYKRSEFMLRRAGILPPGMYTVPGKGASLDAYGNMSRGQIVQILSFMSVFGNSALNSKRMNMKNEKRAALTSKAQDYFVVPVHDRKIKLYPGIWRRKGNKEIIPVLMFVSPPVYKAIYSLEKTALKVVRNRFRSEFDAALAEALRTAR